VRERERERERERVSPINYNVVKMIKKITTRIKCKSSLCCFFFFKGSPNQFLKKVQRFRVLMPKKYALKHEKSIKHQHICYI
jgi:hypothetical protein